MPLLALAQIGPVIDVRDLFAPERSAFLDLLRDLSPGEWSHATVCPGWTVKDIAAHVLHDDLRRVSAMRDGHTERPRPAPGEPLAAWLHRVNEQWVAGMRVLSTRQLLELLALTGDQVAHTWRTLDLHAEGFPVPWTGLETSPVWLDSARELTEYWTHQQQIRDATGRPGLTGREFLAPVLETFVRALPYTLRDAHPDAGSQVQLTITGTAAMQWTATRDASGWWLARGAAEHPAALVEADGDTVWRLCTRNITPEDARQRVSMRGDPGLAGQMLQMVSIIR